MQQLPIIVNLLVNVLSFVVVACVTLLAAKWFGDVRATKLLVDWQRRKEQAEAEQYKRLLSEEIEANLWALRLVRKMMPDVSEGHPTADMTQAFSLAVLPLPALSSEIWDRRTPSLMKSMLGQSRDAVTLYQKFRQMREIVSALHALRPPDYQEMATRLATVRSSWGAQAGKLSREWRELADSAEAQGNPLA